MSTKYLTEKRAISIDEAAVRAGICRDRVYVAIRNGQLPAKKFGRRTLILTVDLDEFLHRLPPLELRPTGDMG